ncbi:MAG: biopolymer transporter ExbD [Planctomycetota bacterium]|nr:MAG: biopolymer transporter ExbD [Planctomycetota bacterium]REJ88711.1 MAG: biopolymer transporter ExbD [Planctomycetota bacterium]
MRLQKQKKEDAEGDMTPMIDIVFQLIAFFMVLVNFTKVDADDRVKLPSSALAKPPEQKLKFPVTLQMTAEGMVILGGDLMDVESPDLDNRLIRERRAAGEKVGPGGIDEVPVIIRAHELAPTGKVQKLITLCQSKGFQRFRLRAKEETKGG